MLTLSEKLKLLRDSKTGKSLRIKALRLKPPYSEIFRGIQQNHNFGTKELAIALLEHAVYFSIQKTESLGALALHSAINQFPEKRGANCFDFWKFKVRYAKAVAQFKKEGPDALGKEEATLINELREILTSFYDEHKSWTEIARSIFGLSTRAETKGFTRASFN